MAVTIKSKKEIELMREAGVNTIGTTKKQLEKIETNIFPVDGVEYENY